MAAGYEFSVGEKVAFVDEDIKGVVKSVSGEKVVITTSDGFEYECSPREIVSQEIAEKGLSDFIKDKDWDYVTHDKYAERRRPTPPSNKARREPPVRVLDLHIEKLLKSTRNMSPGDILDYQMRYARAAVENARAAGDKKLVFVHGVGQGVLKEELSYMLKGYPRCRYYDAAYHLYGEGAMEVEFF
ncbi:MAG: hypothetical protein IJ382_04565 [Flavobacteriales bacterium]|nr:hypothetical protein [Flavobacteriales bacterium]